MKNRVIWVISIIVLICYLLFWHLFVKAFDFSGLFEAIGFISTLLTVLIVSTVLALLLSLFPLKDKKYKERLSVCFPLSLILVCGIVGWAFYKAGPRYDKIVTEPGCDCGLYRNGTFSCEGLLIERNGTVQIQTNIRTNEKETFEVTWLNDCEYQLHSVNGTMKVKIVSGDQNGYDCYTTVRGFTSKRYKLIVCRR